MNRCKLYIAVLSFTFVSMGIPSAFAQTVIAHRGLFHNSSSAYNHPENTATAVIAAAQAGGLGGAEVDLRESSDGTVMVTHDKIINRTTREDNDGGNMNPVYLSLGIQTNAPASISVGSRSAGELSGYPLKWFVTGGTAGIDFTGYSGMVTLKSMLGTLDGFGVFEGNFKLVLDIQDPDIFDKAAGIVTSMGLQNNVYLKFFAKSALYGNLVYNGADTCYVYMKSHNLADPKLQIIPQINDGELDINEDVNAGISIWDTKLTIPEYLDCWSNAHAQHPSNTASMPIVSASVPADNDKATTAAAAAINWAHSNGRQSMSIIPNPDACYADGNAQRLFSFSSTSVYANPFNSGARTAKANFVANERPTYEIVDVMGNGPRSWTTDYNSYVNTLCQ